MGHAVLFSEMTPPVDLEADFNAWYDEEHIPLRMRAPGFRSAQRYRDGESRNYLAVYEMDTADALGTPEYLAIKNGSSTLTRAMLGAVSGFTRYIGRETGIVMAQTSNIRMDAPILYAVFFTVPPDRMSDFDAWYAEDHVPLLMEDTRWLGVRRFDIVDGAPDSYNRMALHYLADRSALESDARRKARATPWRARLATEPWFQARYLTLDRLGSRQMGQAAT